MKPSRLTNLLFIALVLAIAAGCAGQVVPPTQPGQAISPPTSSPKPASASTPIPTASPALTQTPIPLTADLSEASGGVNVKQPEQADFAAAAPPLILQVNGQVRTDEDGRARLDLSTGTILRLAPLTLFTLQDNQPTDNGLLTRIKLALGQLYILLTGGSVEVETESGNAAVRGSYMLVEIDSLSGDTIVQCLEGTCEVSNPTGTLTLTGGQGALLSRFESGTLPELPRLFQLSEDDIRQWLDDNPEILSILPDIQSTLTALPPLPTRERILPTLIATRTPILSLPTFKPPQLPTKKIKPPLPKP